MGNENSGFRKFITIVSSPVWVPVVFTVGSIAAPFRGYRDAIKYGKEHGKDDADEVAEAFSNMDEAILGRSVVTPFEYVHKVGEKMWGD